MNPSTNKIVTAIQESFYPENEGGRYHTICSLHDLVHDENGHNCIACNFSEIIDHMECVANIYDDFANSITAKYTYILWMYLLTERMQEIFRIISMPEEVKSEQYNNYKIIRCWANFLKHPKAFFLTHHPRHIQEQDEKQNGSIIIIDDDFVLKYYSGSNHNRELYSKIENSSQVAVKLPELESLTKGLGQELQTLQEFIANNQNHQNTLRSKTIIESYFTRNVPDQQQL